MFDDEPESGALEGECQACDAFGPVDDLCLCLPCSAKFERDMIRQRAWDYSASAFGLSAKDCEALRAATIAEHGLALELIVSGSDRLGPTENQRGRRARRGRGTS
jgi:hypothetical protein